MAEQGVFQGELGPQSVQQGPAVPELTICKIDKDSVTIPRDVRDKWLRDPHRSPEWREVLRKFDDVFTLNIPGPAVTVAAALAVKDEPASAALAQALDPWADVFSDTATAEAQLGQVAHSFPHSLSGLTWNLTNDNHLYIVATAVDDTNIDAEQYILAYGAGQWLQDQKATAFLENLKNAATNAVKFELASDEDLIIFEEGSDTHKPTDSKPHTLRSRLHTLEKAGHVNIKVGGHDVARPPEVQAGKSDDKYPAMLNLGNLAACWN